MFLRSTLRMFGRVENQNFISPKYPMPSNSTALTMLNGSLDVKRLKPFGGISSSNERFYKIKMVHKAHRDYMWNKIGGPVAGISALTSKYMQESFNMYPFVQHKSKSDEPVKNGGLPRLNSMYGPVIIKSGRLTEDDPHMKLVVPPKVPCKVLNSNHNLCGLGCYYGHGHVLTAYHVIMDIFTSNKYALKHVVFSRADTLLMYRTEITDSCEMFPYFDLGFIKLIGDTSPLGAGLQNRVSEVKENDRVYFYALNPSDRLYKKEGRVVDPDVSTSWSRASFTISVMGNPGDSGSPVYSNGRLVGIYLGLLDGMGYCSKIDPAVKRWASKEF